MTDSSIQAAAKKFALLVAPDITRIVLHGPHGKAVSIAIPPGAKEDSPPVVTLAPAALPGWDFREPQPRFDGVPVPIFGRKRSLLKLLAESPIPLTIEQLKAAWTDYVPENGSVRWTVGDLRRALKELFTDCDDPVSNDASGYTLTIR